MYIDGDTMYSYGSHFPLVIRLAKGGYLINGDRYSVTTSQHQRLVFNLGPQVPFTALRAAGIDGRERYGLALVDATDDRSEWVCRCPGHPHRDRYAGHDCRTGYERHTLGGTLLRHGRRYLLSAIDFESGAPSRLTYFICQLPGKVGSIAEAYESLIPASVKVARAFGAEIQRQGDFFFIKTTLPTCALQRDGHEPVSNTVWRGFRQVLCSGYPLDGRQSHLATELRELAGTPYVRGTVRHAPGEHRMVKLGKAWWAAVQNLARGSWAAAGNVD